MKKRFSTSKIIITTLILLVIMLTGMFVGFSGVSAERDMKEVIGEQFFGEFTPNVLVDELDCEFAPVAWIETKLIGMQADLWERGKAEKETGDPAKQEILHNIYQYDDIESKMIASSIVSPIIQPLSDNANYYVVYYEEIKQINAPQAYVYVGPNAENGVLLENDEYFYDENTGYLYIEESVLTPWIKNGGLMTIRAETLFVYENIETVTKDVELVTTFTEESGAADEHLSGVANRVEKISLQESQFADITYRLVDSNKLAFFSQENMKVYLNGSPFDSWSYDERTGYLTLSANIFAIKNIMVEVSAVNDVNAEQLSLQESQVNDDLTPHAAGLTDVVRDYNEYIDYIQYDEKEPQVGFYQQMDYVSRVILGVDRNGNTTTPYTKSVTGSTHTSFPRAVLDLLTEKAKDNGYVNGYLKSATWATQAQIYDNVSGITRPSTVPAIVDPNMMGSELQSSEVYGEISYYLFLARHSSTSSADAKKYIGYVNDLANAYLFNFSGSRVLTSSDYTNDSKEPDKKQWPTDRLVDNRWHTHCGLGQSRYVCGINRTTETFLGGVVHGSVLIDGDCCNIRGSASWAKDINNVFGHAGQKTDYQCGTSIIYVSPVDSSGYGDMWTCMWSRSLEDTTNPGKDAQRIQSYSKIKYKYTGNGRLRFTKVNEYGELLAGAVYKIYKDDGTYVDSITTNNIAPIEVELRKGSYYMVEQTPPTGYLKDDTKHTFRINIDETLDIEVKDEFQLCQVSFTVYDKTTQGNAVEVAVPNIKFKLIDGSGTPVAFRDKDGKVCDYDTIESKNGAVTFWVRTLDVTPGIQVAGQPPQLYLSQVNTVPNYAKTMEPTDVDYCNKILISAFSPEDGVCPDNSGVNKTTSKRHYEHRQWVTMNAHVQDATLGTDTIKSLFGGDSFNDASSEVRLDGAKFNIMTTSNNVLLGYTDKGDPIYLKPYVLIGYAENGVSDVTNRPTVLTAKATGAVQSTKSYIGITSSLDNTDSMYTTGLSINKFNVVIGSERKSFDAYSNWTNKDKTSGIHKKILDGTFELPNAVYNIVLSEPTSGYRRTANAQDANNTTTKIWDGNGIHEDNIKVFDASWKNDSKLYENHILFLGNDDSVYNVQLHRQTVSIDTFVKGYFSTDKSVSSSGNGNLIRNDFHTINPFDLNNITNYKNGVDRVRNLLTINPNTRKETKTSSATNRITIQSTEYVSVANKDNHGAFSNVLSVRTRSTEELMAEGAHLNEIIIEFYNLTEIVDVDTGKVIRAHNIDDMQRGSKAQPLGRYVVDNNGYVKIDRLGSDKFENPNPLLTNNQQYVDAVYPSAEGTGVFNHALPNGVYYVRIYQLGKDMQSEYGLAENIIYTTAWTKDKITQHHVEDDSLHLVQVDIDGEPYYLNIAPDLPLATDDDLRYNPQDVVGTKNKILIGNEKKLSKILGCRDIDTDYKDALAWIDKHMYDFSYRIFEMINNDPTDDELDNPNNNTEIMDNLPTTFALYIKHNIMYEANVDYHYYMTYYYQITKSEYDKATEAEIENKTYMRVDGLYYKKFDAKELLSTIAINNESAGYVRYVEGGYEIDSNKPVMGAIYNLQWINERMMTSSVEGTYQILMQLEVEKTTTNFLTNEKTVDRLNLVRGLLKIKNRNLFDLD